MRLIIGIIIFAPFYLIFMSVDILTVFIQIALFFAGKLLGSDILDKYTYKQIIATDQSLNALTAGDEDETISGRIGRRIPNSWFAKFLNKIYFWQENHVLEAVETDEGQNDLIQ